MAWSSLTLDIFLGPPSSPTPLGTPSPAYHFTLPQSMYHLLTYYVLINLMTVFWKNINAMKIRTLPAITIVITIVYLVPKLLPKHSGWSIICTE